MFLAILTVIVLTAYMIPGLFLARGMYAVEARSVASQQSVVVPPKPDRPRIKLNEMLHISMPRRCAALDDRACNCKYRDEWVKLKNGWIDYDEWQENYGHIKNGVVKEPKVNMMPIYLAVPGWPVVAAGMFIRGGAKNIPDYRAIERMENELKELA